MNRTDQLAALVRAQREWIALHGGSRAGYVALYGSAADAEHYGDGGEAIYRADRAELDALTAAQGPPGRPGQPPMSGPERRYDLRLADGRVVTWPGTSPEDAARRYVNVDRSAEVVATRPCRADQLGIYAIPDASRIRIIDAADRDP